ncbi:MAG: hypothetical protein ACR2Q4_20905, partial [Geminicoccaceae bacterium]
FSCGRRFEMGGPGCGEEELRRRTEELRVAVEEKVLLGSSPEQVEAFLQEQGIEEYSTGGSRGGNSTISRHSPELAEKTRYVTQAAIRDVYRGFLVSSSIYPRFYYDEERKLIWSTVKIGSDGL